MDDIGKHQERERREMKPFQRLRQALVITGQAAKTGHPRVAAYGCQKPLPTVVPPALLPSATAPAGHAPSPQTRRLSATAGLADTQLPRAAGHAASSATATPFGLSSATR